MPSLPRAAGSAWEQGRSVFAALGDPVRLRLVARLSQEGPLSITRLAAGERVTRQAVTKHLAVLAGAAVVRGAREGREKVWALEPHGLAAARRALDAISREWDARIDRLRALVEGPGAARPGAARRIARRAVSAPSPAAARPPPRPG